MESLRLLRTCIATVNHLVFKSSRKLSLSSTGGEGRGEEVLSNSLIRASLDFRALLDFGAPPTDSRSFNVRKPALEPQTDRFFSLSSTGGEGRGEEVIWNLVIRASLDFGARDLELPSAGSWKNFGVM